MGHPPARGIAHPGYVAFSNERRITLSLIRPTNLHCYSAACCVGASSTSSTFGGDIGSA